MAQIPLSCWVVAVMELFIIIYQCLYDSVGVLFSISSQKDRPEILMFSPCLVAPKAQVAYLVLQRFSRAWRLLSGPKPSLAEVNCLVGVSRQVVWK